MIHDDTIKLLRECNAGIKMGISSIDDVVEKVKNNDMREILSKCRQDHDRLGSETVQMLIKYGDEGKEPNPVSKGMSHIMTGVKMAVDGTDSTIADIMTDGCNMGVKSLSRYLNQYAAAEEKAKDITKKLIKLEETLSHDMRGYL